MHKGDAQEDRDDEDGEDEDDAGEEGGKPKKKAEKRSLVVSVLILVFSIPALVGS